MTEETTLLVADDDIDILDQVCAALAVDKYRILRAESREEAEEILLGSWISLAIVDLMMDEVDSGFVLCHRIKALYPGTPVILLSAVTSTTGLDFTPRTSEERSWLKADLVLHKPVVPDRLRADVRRLLAQAKERDGSLRAVGNP
jgi:DNA-binding response OmpR family regulator